eukprot:506644-Pleurochrysis_carterae.AAC.2
MHVSMLHLRKRRSDALFSAGPQISVPDVDEAHCSTATLQRAQPLAIGDRGLVRLVHASRRTIVLTSSEARARQPHAFALQRPMPASIAAARASLT